MIVASVLVGLCNMTCFIVALPLLAVAMPALVVEHTGPGRALGRSFSLAGPHFLRALGVVITVQALEAVLNLGLAAAIALLFRNNTGASGAIIAQGSASAVAATLVAPFTAAAAVVSVLRPSHPQRSVRCPAADAAHDRARARVTGRA